MRMNVLAVIPSEHFRSFVDKKKLENLDLLTSLSLNLKKAISVYLERNCGVSVGIPLPTLSKYLGKDLTLDVVGKRIGAVFPVMRGTTIWQLVVPDDLVASIPYSTLMEYNERFMVAEGDALELLTEVFQEELTLGNIDKLDDEDDDVVSFIPCIGLDNCKKVVTVESRWDEQIATIPGLQTTKLAVFDDKFI